jgi:lactoylglutathione lyase
LSLVTIRRVKFSVLTLFVADPSACRDFYMTHLGHTVVEESPRYVMVAAGDGCRLGFHVGDPVGNPERVQLHFDVDDVDVAYQRLRDAGIDFEQQPTDMPWGVRAASCRDPAGHTVELIAPVERGA